MSIADKITALQTAKSNIASAITNKGGTVASGDGFSNFASDIATIPSGITPSGSQTFTENGTYDVTAIAEAIVNVSGGGGIEGYKITKGSFTPSETIVIAHSSYSSETQTYTPYIIPHSLGKSPIYFGVRAINGATVIGSVMFADYSVTPCGRFINRTEYLTRMSRSNGTTTNLPVSNGVVLTNNESPSRGTLIVYADDTNIYLSDMKIRAAEVDWPLEAGTTYEWIAIAKEETA